MASSATLSGGTSSGSTSGKSPSRFITFGLLAIASAISLWFLWHYARPYFSWDPKAFDYYWPRRYRLIVHISGGVVALVCGTLQMWTGLRQKAMTFHRWTGRVYLVGVAVGIIGAFLMTRDTTPRVFGVGLMGLATAWLLTTGVAWAAIMRGQVALHKEWVMGDAVVSGDVRVCYLSRDDGPHAVVDGARGKQRRGTVCECGVVVLDGSTGGV